MQICNRLYFSKALLFLPFIFFLTLPFCGFSQSKNISNKNQKSILKGDSLSSKIDSVELKSKIKSNQIDADVVYSAQDSVVFLGNGTGFLHGKSDIKYKNIELKADFIRIKMDSSLIYAKGKTDSTGRRSDEPIFTESKTEYNSRDLTYNLKTKKGFIRQAVTKQGEGYVISDKTKKTADDILCMTDGKYTTCDNHDHPDFYLDITRGKIKPGKYIVAGPAYLVVEDVPLPIALPFGFFPFTDKYSSGILMPTFQDEFTRGFGLANGGYYFAINDYVDLELRGDIYTKGTWSINASSKYLKRYKFTGSLNISYREDVIGEKDLTGYSKSNNMSIRWTHSQDQKANPFFNFNASVNYSTSGYNRSNINSYANPTVSSQSTAASSISFTQRFPDDIPFTITGSMSINQQLKDSSISLSLPEINISMRTIYPFRRKNVVGKERWYEKISLGYSGNLKNSISTKENKVLTSSLSRDWKNGMNHNIQAGASFKLFKYIDLSPSVTYTERWYLQSINRTYDTSLKKVRTDTVSGFNRVFDFNTSVTAQTKLYGFYIPIRSIFGYKVDRIRHVLTPSIGFSYRPDFGTPNWGYYGTYTEPVASSTNPAIYKDQVVQYSHYENSLYGSPGSGKSGNINFSLSNNVEMKVRNDKDTTGTKKFNIISLIDNFSVSGSYNMAVDSMQWSVFSTNLRIKLGKSYTLSLSGSFDPYMYGLSSDGKSLVRMNKLRWANGGFPMFLGTGTSYSYTLNNETFKKKKDTTKDKKSSTDSKIPTKNDTNSANQSQNNNQNNNQKSADKDIDGYQKVKIPWSINIAYNISYGSTGVPDLVKREYIMGFTHGLSLSGNISLTNNWKISSSTSYDFPTKQFTSAAINVTRNLHCWSMSASFVPFGIYKTYSFKIGVNSSMLQDLKYEKQSGYGTTPITWY